MKLNEDGVKGNNLRALRATFEVQRRVRKGVIVKTNFNNTTKNVDFDGKETPVDLLIVNKTPHDRGVLSSTGKLA